MSSVEFHRTFVDDDNFIRGAARLMWAGITIAFPTAVSDIINLSTYDAQANWNDLGATKTGIQVTVNNSEETFDVDQILGDIDSKPTTWDAQVTSQLAEMTLERLQLAWEGSDISTSGGFRNMGVGVPTTYTRRMLAVLFRKNNNKLRAFVFRKVQRAPAESTINYNKTGDQQSVPVRFRALADSSIADTKKRLFMIFDQV